MKWGAPKWPPSLFKREGYAPSDSPASARGAPAEPWHPSIPDARGSPAQP